MHFGSNKKMRLRVNLNLISRKLFAKKKVHISSLKKKDAHVTVRIRCTGCKKSQEWNIFR